MGLRNLFFLAAVAAIVLILRHLLARRGRPGARARTPRVEDMVRCELCGLHVPRSEAFADGDRLFCSRQHLEDHRRRS